MCFKRRISDYPAMLSLVVILLPIVLIAAISFFILSDEKTSNVLWQAIAATATAGAATVALYLGLKEQRDRGKERQEDAFLIEAIICEDLKGLLPLLGRISQICKAAPQYTSDPEGSEKLMLELKDAAQRMEMPAYKEAFALTRTLDSDKKMAVLKIYASLPGLKRRCEKIRNIDQLVNDLGNYIDSGLEIFADIERISYYAKIFLPDQRKHYWRYLKVWSDSYDPDEKSFHDQPK